MVGAHAALPNSSEGQVLICELQCCNQIARKRAFRSVMKANKMCSSETLCS
jgi:hypothetical protein